ncbi:MAG: hypothetical protein ACE5PT_09570 [Gemmatimonadales bacterium]
MRTLSPALAAVCALLTVASPALGQRDAWQDKWYWGAQGGAFLYQTFDQTGATSARQTAVGVGGHWLITKRRAALYFAYDQLIFPAGTNSAVPNTASATGQTPVSFSRGRRIQTSLYAIPSSRPLQVYAGFGFAIQHLSDVIPTAAFATAQEQKIAEEQIGTWSTKAFAVMSGGFQLRFGRLALYGTYQYQPSGSEFLLATDQHLLSGGIRIALTHATEMITTGQ